MKEIPLTHGKVALVDDADYDELSQFRWTAVCEHGVYYAKRFTGMSRNRYERMHRRILQPKDGECVDHINHNTIDNRRSNLRICTARENSLNQSKRPGKSRFKGVCWNKRLGTWMAKIHPNRKTKHLGLFKVEEDAARAYDAAARREFGQYACVNFAERIEDGQ
jgi:hypothetical protein